MEKMRNMHRLLPCGLCDVRMAVPGSDRCAHCDVVVQGTLTVAGARGGTRATTP